MEVKLDTIIFYVKDIQNLKIFYRDNFNLKIIEEDDIWVLLNAGNINIGLHKMGKEYAEKISSNKTNNNVKIVFEVTMPINDARVELISKGIKMKEIKTFENYNYWLCDETDPEGNVFQLKKRK